MKIEATAIEAVLSGARILNGVSICADSGAFVGVIGPNGSGKSTLLKCIYRVLKPAGGTVFLDGKDLAKLSFRESARKMAVLSQHSNIEFDFTVFELVMMGRAPYKRALDRDDAEDLELARHALDIVGMSAFSERSFLTLSGGERQRVMLAQALAQKTSCLILDEPTNHLDIQHQFQTMDIVKSLGVTVIAAIHDLNMAAQYCDQIYALRAGRMAKAGTPKEVLTEGFIRDLFGVESRAFVSQNGRLQIVFDGCAKY